MAIRHQLAYDLQLNGTHHVQIDRTGDAIPRDGQGWVFILQFPKRRQNLGCRNALRPGYRSRHHGFRVKSSVRARAMTKDVARLWTAQPYRSAQISRVGRGNLPVFCAMIAAQFSEFGDAAIGQQDFLPRGCAAGEHFEKAQPFPLNIVAYFVYLAGKGFAVVPGNAGQIAQKIQKGGDAFVSQGGTAANRKQRSLPDLRSQRISP